MHTLDYVTIGVYLAVLVTVILMVRRARTIEDFAVGSRQVPGSIVFASLAANAIGPGYSMGLANKAAANGYTWFFVFLAFSLQTLLVGQFIAPRLRRFSKAYTIGDIMGYRYGSLVKYITGIISILLCAGFVGAIANAAGNIIHLVFGIPFLTGVIITTIAVVAYTTYGGIKVDIITDVLHFGIMAIAIPLIIVFMGREQGLTEMADRATRLVNTNGTSLGGMLLFGLVLSFFLGETLIPPYTNRALAAKNEQHARSGFIKAGIFTVCWFLVCASIGFLAAPDTAGSDNVYLAAMKRYLPVGLYGLVVAVMVNIVMKSQDSLLNAASVSLNNDILRIYNKESRAKNALLITRLSNVIIGVVAVVFALNVPGVIDALLICYTLWAPTVVLPLIIAVVKKNVNPLSGLLSIAAGGIATAIWEWGYHNPASIPSLLVGVIANQFIFWLTEWVVPTTQMQFLKPVNQ